MRGRVAASEWRIRTAGVLATLLILLVSACASPERTATEPAPTPRTPRTVQGYRVQILTTQSKTEADERVEDAVAWWQSLASSRRPAGLGEGELAVDIKWQQPYYRVRLGNFATQTEAEQALAQVRAQFPNAFVVPDVVTVLR